MKTKTLERNKTNKNIGTTELPMPKTIRIDTPFGIIGRPFNEITNTAISNVKVGFDKLGHHPSDDQYYGLKQIALIIEAMALRMHEHPETVEKCPNLTGGFYVSFLPCGVGKTTVVEECIKALLANPIYASVGVIIFLQRCDMIEAMVDCMGLDESQYAVMVSEDGQWADLNRRGVQRDKTTARVLFTTQQRLEKLSKDKSSFAAMTAFNFNRKPRQVRIWDEAIVPAETFSIKCTKIASLVEKLGEVDNTLSHTVLRFAAAVLDTESGGLVDVPNFDDFAVTLEDALKRFKEKADRESIQTLWALRGKTARVTHDPQGNVMIQYADILPVDLGPMLILDASGGQRTTYKLWYQHRKGIRFLDSPQKSYEGYTIHHWDRGSGKSAHHKDKGHADELAEGTAKTINQLAPKDKEVLVIHHKPDDEKTDMEGAIRSRLEGDHSRVHFMTWGMHTATNKYADVEYVFLAGVLQYSSAAYEAVGMAAKGCSIEEGLTEQEIEEIKVGEAYHNILQAACRGKVRKSEGAGCPPGCHLYMIYSSKSLPEDLSTRVFPGAKLLKWTPIPRKLTSQQQAILYELAKLGKREATIKKHILMNRVGIKEIGNLDRSLKNETLKMAMKEKGLRIETTRIEVTVKKENPWGF